MKPGRCGSFETDLSIPDLKKQPLQDEFGRACQPGGSLREKGRGMVMPLVRDRSEVIPSVTRVFSSGRRLYLYYEVYDPAHDGSKSAARNDIHLLTSVSFFQGKAKTYETPLVEAKQLNSQNRHAAVFQLEVPLTQLKPGFYTCQVNVIDDAAGKFLFPRLAMMVRQ